MARTRTRQIPTVVPAPAGVGTELRAVKAYVPTSKWAEVNHRAAKADMTVSAYLNALIDRDELDADGRPSWAVHSTPQELPLTG